MYSRIRLKISRQQFGFMTRRSTVTQLIAYLDLLYNNLDGNIPTSVVYFDIKKAFDSVPHSEILMKLSKFGFDERFTLLFQSYLENRHQVVKVANHLSDRKPVSSGVPQGSVLGPLLFVIYLNDICDCIQNSDYFLFADDLKICNSTSSADVQADISSLHQWTTLNGLEFHKDQTKLLLVGSSDVNLELGGCPITEVSEIKDLGVIIQGDLKSHSHALKTLAKSGKTLQLIRRTMPYHTPRFAKLNLYRSCVLSVLLYSSPVWSPDRQYLRRLERFQSRALRWITGIDDYTANIRSLDILPICFQFIVIDMILFWKIVNKQTDINPDDYVVLASQSDVSTCLAPSMGSRQRKTRKFQCDRNFFARSATNANLLSACGVNFESSPHPFKKNLHRVLLDRLAGFDVSNPCTHYLKCNCSLCRC